MKRNKEKKSVLLEGVKKFFSDQHPVYKVTGEGNNKRVNIFLSPAALVLATFILLLISKFIDLTVLNRDNEYMSIIILQIMIFILPAAIWCRFRGEGYIKRLRVCVFAPRSLILIFSAALAMISGGLLLGMLLGGLNRLSDNFSLYNTFVSKSSGSFTNSLYLILAYALLPAICEELVYRGILCHEYEKGGVLKAVVFSSAFFALLHFDIVNLPTYLLCGAVLCLVMYATRSLVAAMIVHFLYNVFGIFGQPYISRLYVLTGDITLLVIISGVIFLASAAVFCNEAARLYRVYLRSGASSDYKAPEFSSVKECKEAFLDIFKDPYAIISLAVYIIAVVISAILGR